jgi:hypothetical protein
MANGKEARPKLNDELRKNTYVFRSAFIIQRSSLSIPQSEALAFAST